MAALIGCKSSSYHSIIPMEQKLYRSKHLTTLLSRLISLNQLLQLHLLLPCNLNEFLVTSDCNFYTAQGLELGPFLDRKKIIFSSFRIHRIRVLRELVRIAQPNNINSIQF